MGRILLILTLMIGWASAGLAGEATSLWPDIPKATGAPHPEGNEYWRRHHPDLLKHDRNLTMHQGDRQIRASLKKCFDCHTVRDETGQPVTFASEKHFCRACHDYAAVKVDCFMCHRSTPEGSDETAATHAALSAGAGVMQPGKTELKGAILAWLDRVEREDGNIQAGKQTGQQSGAVQ